MRSALRSSAIEVAIIAAITAMIAARIWAPELRAGQNSLLDSWAVPISLRYAAGALLAALFVLRVYGRSKREAARSGQRAIHWQVVAASLGALGVGIAIALAIA